MSVRGIPVSTFHIPPPSPLSPFSPVMSGETTRQTTNEYAPPTPDERSPTVFTTTKWSSDRDGDNRKGIHGCGLRLKPLPGGVSACVELIPGALISPLWYWQWRTVDFEVLYFERHIVEYLQLSRKTVSRTRVFQTPIEQ